MPKEKVNDLITDQEIAFARLILAGELSDQQAAETAGLNPATASYTKAKPRVQAWMQQHRAAMDKLILEQEAENLRRRSATRDRILERLWAIADLGADQTRNNMASQMKALTMIVALEGLMPDRRSAAAQQSVVPAAPPNIYKAEWLREPAAGANTDPSAEQDHQESAPVPLEIAHDPIPSAAPDPGPPVVPRAMTFAEANSSPYTSFVPDTAGGFYPPRNPFVRLRR